MAVKFNPEHVRLDGVCIHGGCVHIKSGCWNGVPRRNRGECTDENQNEQDPQCSAVVNSLDQFDTSPSTVYRYVAPSARTK